MDKYTVDLVAEHHVTTHNEEDYVVVGEFTGFLVTFGVGDKFYNRRMFRWTLKGRNPQG